MSTYAIRGGGHIGAATDLELVHALRLSAQTGQSSVSIEDYMEAMAARCKVYDGSIVRVDSVAHFIADLKAIGFLQLS